MTEDKALKRAIRARMTKTGESYTAARRHVLKQPAKTEPVDYGMTDEAVSRATGKSWTEWLEILDAWGGTGHTHTEIARHLNADHGVSAWWAQAVTVGYERARGMRRPHQRADGYSVSVSKTLPVDAERLFEEVTDARRRNRWLDRGTLKVRTTRPGRSARFDFRDDGSRVQVAITPKTHAKATIQVTHEKMARPDDVETMRTFWKEALTRLGERLSER